MTFFHNYNEAYYWPKSAINAKNYSIKRRGAQILSLFEQVSSEIRGSGSLLPRNLLTVGSGIKPLRAAKSHGLRVLWSCGLMVNVIYGEPFCCYRLVLVPMGVFKIPACTSCCLMAASERISSVSQVFFREEPCTTVALVVWDMCTEVSNCCLSLGCRLIVSSGAYTFFFPTESPRRLILSLGWSSFLRAGGCGYFSQLTVIWGFSFGLSSVLQISADSRLMGAGIPS